MTAPSPGIKLPLYYALALTFLPAVADATSPSIRPDLVIDCSRKAGPFVPMAGFIQVFGRQGPVNLSDLPDSSLLWSLRPDPLRLDPNRVFDDRDIRADLQANPGARIQVVLRQDSDFPKRREGGRPNPAYDSLVRGDIAYALAYLDSARRIYGESASRRIAWDIINEPDNVPDSAPRPEGGYTKRWVTQDTALRNDFLDYWTRMVRSLRAADPSAVIVGPSINNFVPSFLCAFARAARDSGTLPDLLSWHELAQNWETADSIPRHAARMRGCMERAGIRPLPGLSINEWGEMGPHGAMKDSLAPGYEVKFLAALSRAGLHSAMRSCWAERDGGLPCTEGTVIGLLTREDTARRQRPRSVYRVYRAYAEMKGFRLETSPGSDGLDALAVHDPVAGVLRILVGRYRRPGERTLLWLRLDNLGDLGFGASVRVSSRRIRYSGRDPSQEPVARLEGRRTAPGGGLLLGLTDFGPFDAYSIEIRK